MKNRFQILSLDGGGIKGLFSAALLAKIEEDLNIKVADHFDLIVGTSTGGIIALGLGLGLSPKELVEFYFNEGPKIFKKNLLWTFFKKWFFNKYSGQNLENIFRKKDCFEERLLGDSRKRLVIPSYNIDSGNVYVFKTAHHERFKRDFKVPMWKVARATSAAPTFFSISTSVDNMRLIDGGVWANNPAMIGLIEALTILEVPLDKIRIFSVGTTEEVKCSCKILSFFGGRILWISPAIDLIMQAQSASINAQVSLLLKEDFVRIDPKVPKGLFKLDKLNMSKLFAFASENSRHSAPEFEEKFMDYKAEEFIPKHKL